MVHNGTILLFDVGQGGNVEGAGIGKASTPELSEFPLPPGGADGFLRKCQRNMPES